MPFGWTTTVAMIGKRMLNSFRLVFPTCNQSFRFFLHHRHHRCQLIKNQFGNIYEVLLLLLLLLELLRDGLQRFRDI